MKRTIPFFADFIIAQEFRERKTNLNVEKIVKNTTLFLPFPLGDCVAMSEKGRHSRESGNPANLKEAECSEWHVIFL